MPVTYYVGIEGPTLEINSLICVWESLDALHTEVIDNLGEDCAALEPIEDAMDEVQRIIDRSNNNGR